MINQRFLSKQPVKVQFNTPNAQQQQCKKRKIVQDENQNDMNLSSAQRDVKFENCTFHHCTFNINRTNE